MNSASRPLILVAALAWTGLAPAAALGDESFELQASDAQHSDLFGVAVAVDGTLAAVGARGALDAGGVTTGAVYLYDTTTGQEVGKLLAPDGASGDNFGWSVAIHGDRIVVGAPGDDDNGDSSGSAYLFDAGTQQLVAKLLPNDGAGQEQFGYAVAVDGTHVVAGAYKDGVQAFQSGSAYVFDAATGQQIVKLSAADGVQEAWFGESVAVSGGRALIGARLDDENGLRSGAAYVFDAATGAQLHKLAPADGAENDFFGIVALDGTTAAIGAWRDDDRGESSGAVYLFDVATGGELSKLVPGDGAFGDWFGWSVAIEGTRVVIGAMSADAAGRDSGVVYVFDATSGGQIARVLPSGAAADDQIGMAVATRGESVLVGATRSSTGSPGSAYLFATAGLIGTQFCDASDGSLASCPCANQGGPDTGCDVQQATGGVKLLALAQTNTPANRATLTGTGYPAASTPTAVLMRGASLEAAPVVFGDGLRCAAAPLVRASAAFAIGGTSTHAIGHDAPAGAFHYQLWFRSAPGSFCTPAAFNVSGGRTLGW